MAGKNLQTRLKDNSFIQVTSELKEGGFIETYSYGKKFKCFEDESRELTACLYQNNSILHFMVLPGKKYNPNQLEEFQKEMFFIVNYITKENLPKYINGKYSLELSSVGDEAYNNLLI